MEPIDVTISGIEDQDDVLRLLFLYSLTWGREALPDQQPDPTLANACKAHLLSCGECQEALKQSGMIQLASSASQAIVAAELAALVRAEGEPQQTAEPAADDTLAGLEKRVTDAMGWLEVQLDTGSALLDHLQFLQKQSTA